MLVHNDQLFPVLGFGARIPPAGRVSHEFFVNFQDTPFCEGIDGVLEAYYRCIESVQLHGPTNFAPIINHVAEFAAQRWDVSSEYFILLILTDGVIMDMPQTKRAIVNASTLPLSIIIVGIGNANFDAMEELDGDDVRLSSNGHPAARDIVQFVPLRNFLNSSSAADLAATRARLAKEVLAEIPEQFTSYMKANNIEPGGTRASVSAPHRRASAAIDLMHNETTGIFNSSYLVATYRIVFLLVALYILLCIVDPDYFIKM